MPIWTVTPESIEKYKAWQAITREYDFMIESMKVGETYEQEYSDSIINRMEAAHGEWLASMPRIDR